MSADCPICGNEIYDLAQSICQQCRADEVLVQMDQVMRGHVRDRRYSLALRTFREMAPVAVSLVSP